MSGVRAECRGVEPNKEYGEEEGREMEGGDITGEGRRFADEAEEQELCGAMAEEGGVDRGDPKSVPLEELAVGAAGGTIGAAEGLGAVGLPVRWGDRV